MSGQSSSGPYLPAAAGSEDQMALQRGLGFLVKRWNRKSRPSGSISFGFGNRDRLLAPYLLRLWRLQAQLNQFYSMLRTMRNCACPLGHSRARGRRSQGKKLLFWGDQHGGARTETASSDEAEASKTAGRGNLVRSCAQERRADQDNDVPRRSPRFRRSGRRP